MFLSTIALSADAPANLAKFRVLKIKFIGLENVSKKKLLRHLIVQPSPRWKFWHRQQYATLADIEDDLLQIKQFYQNAGYYDTKITYNLEVVVAPKINVESENKSVKATDGINDSVDLSAAVKLVYSVFEGPPVTVRSILINIMPESKDLTKEFLMNLIPTQPRERFETSDYRDSKENNGQGVS